MVFAGHPLVLALRPLLPQIRLRSLLLPLLQINLLGG
jgi:hypothetical protein